MQFKASTGGKIVQAVLSARRKVDAPPNTPVDSAENSLFFYCLFLRGDFFLFDAGFFLFVFFGGCFYDRGLLLHWGWGFFHGCRFGFSRFGFSRGLFCPLAARGFLNRRRCCRLLT